jgi:hypothetical protein
LGRYTESLKNGEGIHRQMDRQPDTQAYGQQDDLISVLSFCQNKESRLKVDLRGTGWVAVP